MANRRGKIGNCDRVYFPGLWNHLMVTSHRIKRCLLLGRKVTTNLSSVQFSRWVMSNSLQPHGLQHARLPWPSPTLGLAQTHVHWSVMPSNHLILCRPLLLLPPISPSIRVFSNESSLRMIWPKYWSFSFSIIPSKEIPGLISFKMDWLDLLAVHGLSRVLSNNTV